MTKGQFKDLVSHMCLAGAVVASWFLTQEVVGSNPFTIMTIFLSLNSLNLVKTFRENSNDQGEKQPTWKAWFQIITQSYLCVLLR